MKRHQTSENKFTSSHYGTTNCIENNYLTIFGKMPNGTLIRRIAVFLTPQHQILF